MARRPACSATASPCPICQRSTTDYVLDHCHTTDISREAICRSCNAGLGMFKDNPDALERAAAYLRQHAARGKAGGVAWVRAQHRAYHPRASASPND